MVWDGRANDRSQLGFLFFVQPITSGSPPHPKLYYWPLFCIVSNISNNAAGLSPSLSQTQIIYFLVFMFCLVFLHPLASMTFSYSKGQHSFMLVCFGMEAEPRCVKGLKKIDLNVYNEHPDSFKGQSVSQHFFEVAGCWAILVWCRHSFILRICSFPLKLYLIVPFSSY